MRRLLYRIMVRFGKWQRTHGYINAHYRTMGRAFKILTGKDGNR